MTRNYDKLKTLLIELFRLDQSNLDLKPEMQRRNILFQEEDGESYVGRMLEDGKQKRQ